MSCAVISPDAVANAPSLRVKAKVALALAATGLPWSAMDSRTNAILDAVIAPRDIELVQAHGRP